MAAIIIDMDNGFIPDSKLHWTQRRSPSGSQPLYSRADVAEELGMTLSGFEKLLKRCGVEPFRKERRGRAIHHCFTKEQIEQLKALRSV